MIDIAADKLRRVFIKGCRSARAAHPGMSVASIILSLRPGFIKTTISGIPPEANVEFYKTVFTIAQEASDVSPEEVASYSTRKRERNKE